MNKAVFLDKDGTIVEDVGYMNSHRQVKLFPGSAAAIKKLNEAGYKVIIISNQAGVARGLVTEDMIQTIDKTINKQLLSGGAHLDATYYCPHHPEHGHYPYKQACECRKPKTGLIDKAQKKFDLDLTSSFMIGDKATDIECGRQAGIKTIMVKTGYGEVDKAKPDHVADNLAGAVEWLLQQ